MYVRVTEGPEKFDFSGLTDSQTSLIQVGGFIATENVKSGMLVLHASSVEISGVSGTTTLDVVVRAALRLASGAWVVDESDVGTTATLSTGLVDGASGLFRVSLNTLADYGLLPGPALVVLVKGKMGSRATPPTVLRATLEIGLELLPT